MTRSMMKEDPQAPLMSAADVARRLKLSLRTIRRLITSDELEVVRIGRSVRVAEAALQAFITASVRR